MPVKFSYHTENWLKMCCYYNCSSDELFDHVAFKTKIKHWWIVWSCCTVWWCSHLTPDLKLVVQFFTFTLAACDQEKRPAKGQKTPKKRTKWSQSSTYRLHAVPEWASRTTACTATRSTFSRNHQDIGQWMEQTPAWRQTGLLIYSA